MIRSITISDDRAKGRGWARMVIAGTDLPHEALALRIVQGGRHLTPDGFQTGVAEVHPTAAEELDDGGLSLLLGPDIVQHMRAGNYTFELVSHGASVGGKAAPWKAAPYRPTAGDPPPVRQPVTITSTRTTTPGVLGGSTTPTTDGAGSEATTITETKGVTDKKTTAQRQGAGTEMPASGAPLASEGTKGPKTRIVAIIAGVASLLVLLAAGGWWAYQQGIGPFATADAEPTPAPAPAAAPSTQAPTLSATDRAQQFLATTSDPAAIATEAAAFLAEGEVGVAIILYRRAADGGHAPALLDLARIYDPTSDVGDAANKRADFAYNFYRRARQGGSADAETAITALGAWAEEQARAGHGDAAQLLRLIQLETEAR